MCALGTELRGRRQFRAAVRAASGKRRGTLLAEFSMRSILVSATGACAHERACNSDSSFSSQYVMPISRNIVVAF